MFVTSFRQHETNLKIVITEPVNTWGGMNRLHLMITTFIVLMLDWFNKKVLLVKGTGHPKISLSLRCHAHGPLAKRLMHMAHLSGNTSGVSKSSSDWLNYTGFPGDASVAFFYVPPRNKDAVTSNPLTKEESHRVYKCDDERLSGSTKHWIFKSMWNI